MSKPKLEFSVVGFVLAGCLAIILALYEICIKCLVK